MDFKSIKSKWFSNYLVKFFLICFAFIFVTGEGCGSPQDENYTYNIKFNWTVDSEDLSLPKSTKLPGTITFTTDGAQCYWKLSKSEYLYDQDDFVSQYDEDNNEIGRFVFSGWSPNPKEFALDYNHTNIDFSGTWKYYTEWHNITYDWGDDVPEGVTLPKDTKDYYPGYSFTADDTYTSETTIQVKDKNGDVIGIWSFSGWNQTSGTIKDKDITLKGKWTYKGAKAYHLTYNWGSNVPSGVSLPIDSNTYYYGDSFIANSTYTSKTTIQAKDVYGNVVGIWSFSGWNQTSGTFSDSDITLTGHWTYMASTLYHLSYNWGSNVPGGVTLPTDSNAYYYGDSYTADTRYTSWSTIDVKNEDGFVIGTWHFSGWSPASGTFGNSDISLTGSWRYEEAETYSLIYSWGIADEQDLVKYGYNLKLPDSLILPVDTTKYYSGSDYTADTKYYRGYTEPATDEEGNVIGKWVFDGWVPSSGTFRTSNQRIVGKWTFQEADTYTLAYDWGETAPEDVTLPTDTKSYFEGSTYTTDSTYTSSSIIYEKDDDGNVIGTWTFSGWSSTSGTFGTSNITLTGSWNYKEKGYQITYKFTGEIPDSVSVPVDSNEYEKGDTFNLDTTYEEGYSVGSDTGQYVFEGWEVPESCIEYDQEDNPYYVVNEDVEITGNWWYSTELETNTYE